MDSKDLEFNSISFEKKLSNLKDSQESINTCCQWCLANRQYHKKIVSSWLNVLKRVKVEQRLVLFYLANDVIQYAKRRNYEFVESWGTTLQKATTMVRDEKIKHKVLRIFKIWEQRGIYGEEFISDLSGLISAQPSGKKNDDPHEFQCSYLIHKLKLCTQLEIDTDAKLRELKEHNPKIQIDADSLIASLKDRAHVDDVEKEVEDYNKQMELYITALKLEIKARINLISLLTQAEKALDNDKKDVKTVATAYKAFATRVKTLKKKLDEKIPSLSSPPPSPDVNAPSPGPDSDIELPVSDSNTPNNATTDSQGDSTSCNTPTNKLGGVPDIFSDAATLYTNAGYYNPVPPPTPLTEASTTFNNRFSTFIGSDFLNLQNFKNSFQDDQKGVITTSVDTSSQAANSFNANATLSSLFPSIACPPPPPATSLPATTTTTNFQYSNSSHIPLNPPPMPMFKSDSYSGPRFTDTFNGGSASTTLNYEVPQTSYSPENSNTSPQPPLPSSSPFIPNEEYNPEEELETWEPEPMWDDLPPVEMDTPESPPLYEKAGYADPIEFRDGVTAGNVEDIDHRVLIGDRIHSQTGDIDHRNLISLTNSPHIQDQDYRNLNKSSETSRSNTDQDYRTPFGFENFKLPPPPPPPPKMLPDNMMNNITAFNMYPHATMASQFNNFLNTQNLNTNTVPSMLPKPFDYLENNTVNENKGRDSMLDQEMEEDHAQESDCFELPPPFPDLMNDADANQFLDDVREDLEEFDTDDLDQPQLNSSESYEPTNMFNYSNPGGFNQNMLPPPPPWLAVQSEYSGVNPFGASQNYQAHDVAGQINFNSNTNREHGTWGFNRGGKSEFRGSMWRGTRGRSSFRGNRGRNSRGNRGRGDRSRADFRGNFRGSF